MNSEMIVTKKIADVIVEVCFDVVEFSRLLDSNHPDSAKNIFGCNQEVKKGLEWFISSANKNEMLNNINAYIKSVKTALRLYENLNISIQNKDRLIIQLTNLQNHLVALQKQVQLNS